MNRITGRKNNFIIIICAAFIFIINSYNYVSADIVSLSDGSVMNGKVIENSEKEITLVNFYGTFKISKTKIIKLVETASYKEDMEIRKQMGLKTDEESIKRDYMAGEAEKEKKDAKKNSARISISGSRNYTLGKLNSVLPSGYGFTVDYDHNLLRSYERDYIPWMRLEGGYSMYKKDSCKVTGYNISAGPVLLFPVMYKFEIKLVLSILPGISFLNIENNSTDYKTGSNTFTLNSLAGVEIPYGRYGFIFIGRYTYIYDKDVSLNNLGISAGLSYSF